MTSLLQDLRRECNAVFEQIGFPAIRPFLRRARSDDYLLCSDAPRKLSDPQRALVLFHQAGISIVVTDGLWQMDASIEAYIHMAAMLPAGPPDAPQQDKYLPLWHLCRMLQNHPAPVKQQPLTAVRQVIKAMETDESAILSLPATLSPVLARMLRNKEALPALAGGLLSIWLSDSIRKEPF